MMERLEARGRVAGEAGVARVLARVAEQVREEVPGAAVQAGEGEVVIAGRGLGREPRLRWIGGLLR